MATPLRISAGRGGDGPAVVTVTGEIDLSNVDAFEAALVDVCAQALQGPVTVDLSGVDYLDSGGINVLFGYADEIELVANPILMPVLKISGLADVVDVRSA
jgi:anti-anti-sigma factor